MDSLFGLDLMFHIVEQDLSKKSDILLIFTHWLLSKKGFKCIGLGESETFNGDEPTSDVPPEGWNKDETYAVRYVKDEALYILRGVKASDDLVLNLLRVSDLEVASVAININEAVAALKGKIEEMMPKHMEVMSTLQKELVDPLHVKTSKSATTQTQKDDTASSSRDNQERHSNPEFLRDPLRNPVRDPLYDPLRDPLRDPIRGPSRDPFRDPLRDPLRVGHSDLHPFGSGGGMIFDPFGLPSRPNVGPNYPRGFVPPGARYDPIGPPDLGVPRPRARGPGPDPDHLPPPGYDDMFM